MKLQCQFCLSIRSLDFCLGRFMHVRARLSCYNFSVKIAPLDFKDQVYMLPFFCTFYLSKLPHQTCLLEPTCCPIFSNFYLSKWHLFPLKKYTYCLISCSFSLSKLPFLKVKLKHISCPIFCNFSL